MNGNGRPVVRRRLRLPRAAAVAVPLLAGGLFAALALAQPPRRPGRPHRAA